MRYYFHVREGDCLIPDEEGSDLPDLAAARQEAWLSARDFALECMRQGREVDGRRIEITDAVGTVLETVAVRDAIRGSPTR